MSKNNENKLVPKLRFPEFINNGHWSYDSVENLISSITPPKKLYSSEYLVSGKYPIIDQSQNFYCGWTNDSDAILDNDLPLVVFGDHTCILKLINEPFAQGADGIKIIKPKNALTTEYLFHYFNFINVKQGGYKRHFSILKDKIVSYPNINTGEQQKISTCLSFLDKAITLESQKLEVLKEHKKGLLQNLFPQKGKTIPSLRFKEFEKDGEWVEKRLDEIADFVKGRGISKADIDNKGKRPCIRYGELYTHYGEVIKQIKSFTNLNDDDLILSKPNDVIIPSSGETREDIATASCVKLGGVALGGDLTILRSSLNGDFLAYYLSHGLKDAISEIAQGDAVVHLYATQLKKLTIRIPFNKKEQQINKEEQQKIADILSSLDDLISVQNQKLGALQIHKKGLLQGLFPSQNEDNL